MTLGFYTGANRVGSNYRTTTLRSLATYSSGFPKDDITNPTDFPPELKKPYTVSEMFTYLSTDPFGLGPVRSYAYSNLGFALLGALVSGQSYEAKLREDITGRRQIDVDFDTLDRFSSSSSTLPRSYHEGSEASLESAKQYPAYNPAGGLVVSSDAFMNWLQYNMGLTGRPALRHLLAQTLTPSGLLTSGDPDKVQQICLAWFRDPKTKFLHKDGGTLGFSSCVQIAGTDNPGSDPSPAGVFIFVNQRQPGAVAQAMREIFNIIDGSSSTPLFATPEIDGSDPVPQAAGSSAAST